MAPSLPPLRENFVILRQPLWVMRHDEDAEVAQAVAQAWELWQTQVQGQHGGVTSETGTGGSGFLALCASLFEFPVGAVRRAAAKTAAGHSGLSRGRRCHRGDAGGPLHGLRAREEGHDAAAQPPGGRRQCEDGGQVAPHA